MNTLAIIPTFRMTNKLPTYLEKTLLGWKKQEKQNSKIDVVISDTQSSRDVLELARKFYSGLQSNLIQYHILSCSDHIPVFVSFNTSMRYFNGHNHDYYVYCSDDTEMQNPNDLSLVLGDFTEDVAIVSGKVNKDNSIWHFKNRYETPGTSPIKVGIGDAINLHFMAFSKYFMERYNYKYIDIITGFGTESILTYLCSAIQKKWVLCRKVLINNNLDVSEKPQRSHGYHSGFKIWGGSNFDDIFADAVDKGLGFQAWQRYCKPHKKKGGKLGPAYYHNLNCYDVHGNCINPNLLYKTIIDKLFVKVNYDEYVSKLIVL